LREALVRPLFLSRRVLQRERHQRGRKIYSLRAPEVECIGKGKAHRPYEFGVKVSVATPVKQFRRRAVRHPRRSAARKPL
jgi:IS5 family transposase